MKPTKGDLEKAETVVNQVIGAIAKTVLPHYENRAEWERAERHVAQALAEARAEAVKEVLEHCHGVVMDLNKSELQSEYEKGQLHGAIACENGIYFMLKEIKHSLTGEGK